MPDYSKNTFEVPNKLAQVDTIQDDANKLLDAAHTHLKIIAEEPNYQAEKIVDAAVKRLGEVIRPKQTVAQNVVNRATDLLHQAVADKQAFAQSFAEETIGRPILPQDYPAMINDSLAASIKPVKRRHPPTYDHTPGGQVNTPAVNGQCPVGYQLMADGVCWLTSYLNFQKSLGTKGSAAVKFTRPTTYPWLCPDGFTFRQDGACVSNVGVPPGGEFGNECPPGSEFGSDGLCYAVRIADCAPGCQKDELGICRPIVPPTHDPHDPQCPDGYYRDASGTCVPNPPPPPYDPHCPPCPDCPPCPPPPPPPPKDCGCGCGTPTITINNQPPQITIELTGLIEAAQIIADAIRSLSPNNSGGQPPTELPTFDFGDADLTPFPSDEAGVVEFDVATDKEILQ